MLKKISAILSFSSSFILIILFGILILQSRRPTFWIKYLAPMLILLNGFNIYYIIKTGFGWEKEIIRIDRENRVIKKQIEQTELKKQLQQAKKDIEAVN